MKKTKLTRSLLAACSIVALSAVMYGCVHNGGDDAPATDMSGTPEPVPEPTPDPGPTDLDVTQTEAADAATAAMTASTNAAASASSAAAATMTLATLQTGADSNAADMGGREAAYAAHAAAGEAAAEAAKAATASAAAAAAATGSEAEAALRMALDAQGAAEAAEATAATMAKAAIAAAATELHIVDTVKTVGESSVDATSGMVTSADGLVITGLLRGSEPARSTAASEGQEFVQDSGPATETEYKQAIADGVLKIGKLLDTSDDKARLMLITGRQGKKTVRVFVDREDDEDMDDITAQTGRTAQTVLLVNNQLAVGTGTATHVGGTLVSTATAKSIGLYYEAADRHVVVDSNAAAIIPAIVMTPGTPVTIAAGHMGQPDGDGTPVSTADVLDAYDRVIVSDANDNPAKGVEIFEITLDVAAAGDVAAYTATGYARLERTSTDDAPSTTKFYQMVDIIADRSMTDGGDINQFPDNLDVTVSLPVVEAYEHIHFGVWANLNAKGSAIADLGIGFVQNIDGSGVTEKQGIGAATFNGDWVAAVRRKYASDAEAGAIKLDSGSATLTADFEDGEFTGVLAGLATLEGTLSGNGFSGIKATASHDDLDSDGTFAGEFSGGIYGPTGSEAAGVFDFDGDEAGAFRGAFGGAQ